MNQRAIWLLAAAMTTFVLVLVGGVAGRLMTVSATPTIVVAEPTIAWPTETAVVVEAPAATAGLDPTVEALLREREAAYQAALADAQARLAEANQRILNSSGETVVREVRVQATPLPTQIPPTQAPVAQAPAAQVPVAVPAADAAAAQRSDRAAATAAAPVFVPPTALPNYAVSVGQAEQIARQLDRYAPLTKPIELVDAGGVMAYEVAMTSGTVYIDATTGAILASTIVPPEPQQPQPYEDDADDEEREDDEDDDEDDDDDDEDDDEDEDEDDEDDDED